MGYRRGMIMAKYREQRRMLGLLTETDTEVQCRLLVLNAHLDWLYKQGVNVNECFHIVVPELYR